MHYRHRINGDLITETTLSHLSKKDKSNYIPEKVFEELEDFELEDDYELE